jgi:predicted transcriptional regulator
MGNKEFVIEIVRNLPETASLPEIADEIAVLAAIQQGEEDAEAGRVTPHEEVIQMIALWAAK